MLFVFNQSVHSPTSDVEQSDRKRSVHCRPGQAGRKLQHQKMTTSFRNEDDDIQQTFVQCWGGQEKMMARTHRVRKVGMLQFECSNLNVYLALRRCHLAESSTWSMPSRSSWTWRRIAKVSSCWGNVVFAAICRRHVGHVEFISNHMSTQVWWNRWAHRSCLNSSPSSNGIKQMMHVGESSPTPFVKSFKMCSSPQWSISLSSFASWDVHMETELDVRATLRKGTKEVRHSTCAFESGRCCEERSNGVETLDAFAKVRKEKRRWAQRCVMATQRLNRMLGNAIQEYL